LAFFFSRTMRLATTLILQKKCLVFIVSQLSGGLQIHLTWLQ
jgi:hypothetical protein